MSYRIACVISRRPAETAEHISAGPPPDTDQAGEAGPAEPAEPAEADLCAEPEPEPEPCGSLSGTEVFAVARDVEDGRPVVHMAYAGQPDATAADAAAARFYAFLAIAEAVARDRHVPESCRNLGRAVLEAVGRPVP